MEQLQKQFVGVDCHKDTIACYVNGKFKEFKTNFKGFQKALEWAGKDCLWALEGAYSYGLIFSEYLLNSGCKVYEFNALTTAKARKALNISGEKNDYGDAKVISIFANHTKLQEVSLKTIALKRKLTQRKMFVKQRTELINNLKAMFIQTGIRAPFKSFTTQKAISWLLNNENSSFVLTGRVLKELTLSIQELEKEIEEILPEDGKRLTRITGIRTLTAATIYTELKGKKMTKAQLASYCGVAPVECSSGITTKFRNNKRGNRTLNSVLYFVSLIQSKYDVVGREYFNRKIQEGKTPRHARKCLSRQISNLIYKTLWSA